MANAHYIPKAGDVVISKMGVYRMYYVDPRDAFLRCMSLMSGSSYDATVTNSVTNGGETFVFNMTQLCANNT